MFIANIKKGKQAAHFWHKYGQSINLSHVSEEKIKFAEQLAPK